MLQVMAGFDAGLDSVDQPVADYSASLNDSLQGAGALACPRNTFGCGWMRQRPDAIAAAVKNSGAGAEVKEISLRMPMAIPAYYVMRQWRLLQPVTFWTAWRFGYAAMTGGLPIWYKRCAVKGFGAEVSADWFGAYVRCRRFN